MTNIFDTMMADGDNHLAQAMGEAEVSCVYIRQCSGALITLVKPIIGTERHADIPDDAGDTYHQQTRTISFVDTTLEGGASDVSLQDTVKIGSVTWSVMSIDAIGGGHVSLTLIFKPASEKARRGYRGR